MRVDVTVVVVVVVTTDVKDIVSAICGHMRLGPGMICMTPSSCGSIDCCCCCCCDKDCPAVRRYRVISHDATVSIHGIMVSHFAEVLFASLGGVS